LLHYTTFKDNVNVTLKQQAIQAKIYSDYLVLGNETVVTGDITSDLKTKCTYVLGAPKYFDLTLEQYQAVLDNSAFTNTSFNWSATAATNDDIVGPQDFGKAGLVIVNKIQSTINNRYEGHYIGITDNINIQPNSDHTGINAIYTNGQAQIQSGITVGGATAASRYIKIPTTKLAFPLSATTDTGSNRNNGSMSEALEKTPLAFTDISSEKFDDTISFGLFKLRTSPYNPDAVTLGYAFEEARCGSFDNYRQLNNQNGGLPTSFFIENTVNNSNNINILVNSFISSKNLGPWLDNDGIPIKKVRVYTHSSSKSLTDYADVTSSRIGYHLNDLSYIDSRIEYADAAFPVGSFSTFTTAGKAIGLVGYKLDRTLRKIENDEIFDLDLVCEAGLGTIYATACANHINYFDDSQSSDGLVAGMQTISQNEPGIIDDPRNDVKINYNAIFTIFDNFCSQVRKDCLFIADPLRQIFITGTNNKVMSDHNKAFSQYIYNPLKHLYENANSSYSCVYGNWAKVLDIFSGLNIWVPFSGFVAADMANVDRDFEPWYAPAGFTRGRITNVLDVAITPKQKERDMLYKIAVNPVAFFPNDGINIFGQKTLLRQPSAFDRINVRRLFLYLEKATKKTTKYFVFEPNTSFTRNRVVSTLSPIFDRAKNTQGLYDYQIVCDQRNNTPDIIDQNELIVDIYIKPVRAAEFILVNFYATSTGANFSEIIGA
jgi:phage tail sheath protein FI